MPRKPKRQQLLAIIRDHSGSMSSLKNSAAKDYNTVVASLQSASKKNHIETFVSVIKCGVGRDGHFEFEEKNRLLPFLAQVKHYGTDGNYTPLFDSVNAAIEHLESFVVSGDCSFLVMAITDGIDNNSVISGPALGAKIQQLQGTDRWTFTFRVPERYKRQLANNLKIPESNILAWDQTEEGFRKATESTVAASNAYYAARTKGVRSTRSFYADMNSVAPADVRSEMDNITKKARFFRVRPNSPSTIRDFMEKRTKKQYEPGSAFYELTKSEIVQDYKKIAIRNRKSRAVYIGDEARHLLKIPTRGKIRLHPGRTKEFDIFVQSTSYNRVLVQKTSLMYYRDATYQPNMFTRRGSLVSA
jgi:hypothetical protein